MKVLCAYNVNLDAVHTIDGKKLSSLLRSTEIDLGTGMPESISSPSDFFSALISCIRNGIGAELLVNDKDTADFIENSFDWSYRLGGNAGNMANVLAALGSEPVLNVPALTPKVASMLRVGVMVPDEEGNLVFPKDAVRDSEDLVHFVLQFKGGTEIETPLGKVISPRENRFIATYDRLNPAICLDQNFRDYALKHLHESDGALISGMHLVSQENYRRSLDSATATISEWKEKMPGLYIHAEMGSFQSIEAAHYLLDHIAADSIGMNEDELASIRILRPGLEGIIEAAIELRREMGISRICIHTKDFVISAIRDMISPEREVEALAFGAGVAATLVSTGEIRGEIEPGLELSRGGREARDAFCREMGAVRFKEGAYIRSGEEISCLVPAFYVKQPRVTVGTGDAMTASAYYREVLALRGPD